MLDVFLVLILFLSALAGFRQGAILELGSILGFLAGLWCAATFWVQAAIYAHQWIQNLAIAAIVGFVVPFVIGYGIVVIIATIIRGLVHLVLLGWLDRGLGAVIGLIQGIFVLEIALLLFRLPGAPTNWLTGSQLVPILQAQQTQLLGWLFTPFATRIPLLGTFF